MEEEARQSVTADAWRGLDPKRQQEVLTMLRLPVTVEEVGVSVRAAVDALEAMSRVGQANWVALPKDVVSAYEALHEAVVYQMRGGYSFSVGVGHALDRLEHLGIISAAGGVSDEVADREGAAVVRTLSKALDRHKAHGAAGLAEIAAEQIDDLKRQLRAYDHVQRVQARILDRWKALAQKRKRELKRLKRDVEAKMQFGVCVKVRVKAAERHLRKLLPEDFEGDLVSMAAGVVARVDEVWPPAYKAQALLKLYEEAEKHRELWEGLREHEQLVARLDAVRAIATGLDERAGYTEDSRALYKLQARAQALQFWLSELVDAASSGSGPSPRAVVTRLEKQFPGWRG